MAIEQNQRVRFLPREDFSDAVKEMWAIDPPTGTVLEIKEDKALVEPKMGDDPFWMPLSRLVPVDY